MCLKRQLRSRRRRTKQNRSFSNLFLHTLVVDRFLFHAEKGIQEEEEDQVMQMTPGYRNLAYHQNKRGERGGKGAWQQILFDFPVEVWGKVARSMLKKFLLFNKNVGTRHLPPLGK